MQKNSLEALIISTMKDIENSDIPSYEKIEKKTLLMDIKDNRETNIIYDASSSLLTKSSIDNVFINAEKSIDALLEMVESYSKDVSKLNSISITKKEDNKKLIESNNSDSVNVAITKKVKVRIDKTLTINSKDFSRKPKDPKDIIVKTNGFIGDTRRVQFNKGIIEFIGNPLHRCSLSSLIDKNLFCIESYSITKEEFKRHKGEGFEYEEGVSYITNNDTLSSFITFVYDNVSANYLEFKDAGPFMFTIKELLIEKSDGNIVVIANNIGSAGENIFFFDLMSIRRVSLHIEQKNVENVTSIRSNSGHIGSLALTGMHYDKGVLEVSKWDRFKNLDSPFKIEFDKSYAFTKRLSTTIGEFAIRGIEFEEEGLLEATVSSDHPIKKITLSAVEDIYDKQDVKYYISLDGSLYHEIVPSHRITAADYCSIMFSHKGVETKMSTKQILTSYEVKKLYVKIVLKTKRKESSPIVRTVKLGIEEVCPDEV